AYRSAYVCPVGGARWRWQDVRALCRSRRRRTNRAAHPAVWRNRSSCRNTPKSPEKVGTPCQEVLRVRFCKVLDHNTSLLRVSNHGRCGDESAAVQKNAAEMAA